MAWHLTIMGKTLPQRKLAYSLDEAAAILGASRHTLWRFTRSGQLRVARIGHRTVRVTEEAIMDFLRARETRAVRPPVRVARNRAGKLASGLTVLRKAKGGEVTFENGRRSLQTA